MFSLVYFRRAQFKLLERYISMRQRILMREISDRTGAQNEQKGSK